ncbi:MAG: isoprenylcysteine carboxylmethyltransferase family protein [Phycisphaerales bacterium]|nr:isoprenylcysteine carboxylmethyltransferase family protein [Phycisphaerales bacterium]
MEPNGTRFPRQHPRLFAALVILKRFRTKVGFVLAGYCLAEGLYEDEVPFDLDRPNMWVVIGLGLVFTGFMFRFAAYGCLKKKELLATSGVYSLCRHPLYLGSILLTYGFCFLLDDIENYVFATAYFATFYTIAIAWEEIRLAERYGDSHDAYRKSTPLLLPLGRFRGGAFALRQALGAGGLQLMVATIALLSAVEAMAEFMPPR